MGCNVIFVFLVGGSCGVCLAGGSGKRGGVVYLGFGGLVRAFVRENSLRHLRGYLCTFLPVLRTVSHPSPPHTPSTNSPLARQYFPSPPQQTPSRVPSSSAQSPQLSVPSSSMPQPRPLPVLAGNSTKWLSPASRWNVRAVQSSEGRKGAADMGSVRGECVDSKENNQRGFER